MTTVDPMLPVSTSPSPSIMPSPPVFRSAFDRMPELDLNDGDDSASVDSLPSPMPGGGGTPERVCTITPRPRRNLLKRKLEYEGKVIRLGFGTGFTEVYEGGRVFVTRRMM